MASGNRTPRRPHPHFQSTQPGVSRRRAWRQVGAPVAIQRLTQDVPDHASVVQLTGVYHNLLRQWSEL